MSYDIYIGEASISPNRDDAESLRSAERGEQLEVVVYAVELPDAPAFAGDKLSAHKNNRHPGYSQWVDFCRAAGLESLFFDADHGLMRHHPGCVLLTPDDLVEVQQAMLAWQVRYPDVSPAFGQRDEDGIFTRLVWLEWWIRWALEHCRTPAIYNR